MRPPPDQAEEAAGRHTAVDVFRHAARALGVWPLCGPDVVVMQITQGPHGTAVARIGGVVIRISTGTSAVKAILGCAAGQLLQRSGAPVVGLLAGPVLLPSDAASSHAGPVVAAAWRFRHGALPPGPISDAQAYALGRAWAEVCSAGRALQAVASPLASPLGEAVLRQLTGGVGEAGTLPTSFERSVPWDPFPLLAPRVAACDWLDADQAHTLGLLAGHLTSRFGAIPARVLAHGDFGPRNCGIDDVGRAFLFDFDSAALAPVGYDLACLWLRLHHEAGRPDLGRIAVAAAMAHGHPVVDDGHWLALAAVKAVVQIVFRLTQGPTPANRRFVSARLAELAGLLRAEPLPDRLTTPR